MAYHERGYYRDPIDSGGFGGGGPGGAGGVFGSMKLWSFNTWIIVINIAVFVIDALLQAWGGAVIVELPGGAMEVGPLWAFGYFSADTAILGGQIWRFITFQFLHAGLGHIFFNMLALYFFGRMVESYLGSKRYLAFYLIAGIAGPIAYMFLWQIGLLNTLAWTPLVGASAGVFGVLIGAATVAPNTTVMLLFPPIPMKLRTLAWVLVGIGALMVLTGGRNAGGEAAHLGGAAVGFLLIRNAHRLDWANRFSMRRTPGSMKQGFEKKVASHKRQRDAGLDREVDRILAKVHEQGLASLTDKEKRILRDATHSKRAS